MPAATRRAPSRASAFETTEAIAAVSLADDRVADLRGDFAFDFALGALGAVAGVAGFLVVVDRGFAAMAHLRIGQWCAE
jgi:hypothetical protein